MKYHFVEFQKPAEIRDVIQQGRQLRKIVPILAGADFVERLAQTVNIGLSTAWPFRRNEAFRADIRTRLIDICNQANVGKFRNSVYKNNVRRLDITVDQPVFMKFAQCQAQGESELNALLY